MVILAFMVGLPAAEVLARELFHTTIIGSIIVVQHLTLWIAFVGAMLAAREGRLLSLTGEISWHKERWGIWASVAAGIVSVGVTLVLAKASFVLVMAEPPRRIIGPIQVWMAQAIMPLGFALVAWRLLMRSSHDWRHRLVVVGGVLFLAFLGLWLGLQGGWAVYAGFGGLLIAVALGAPIFVAMGGAAVLLFWNQWGVMAAIPAETYRIVVSSHLATIPLFTLAGYFFAEGGASRRLVRVFHAWFGWIPGGTPVVVVLVCAFFTSFTGGSGVTILALGGLLFPMLVKEHYSARFSVGLLTASGSVGLLFPPSLPVILYGVMSHTSINRLFLGGIVPGLLLITTLAAWGVRQGFVSKAGKAPFTWAEAGQALWNAKWEVLLPVIILFGIYGGRATLVETAAVAALYAFVVETFVYRDLSLRKDVIPTVVSCATLVGGVLIILGVAMGLTGYLVDAQVPSRALHWVLQNIDSKLVFLLVLNGALLVVGAMMDIFSAIIVVVPLIAPMGLAFGVDPVHLGIIFLVNLELGYLTPPIGMNLFLSSYRFNQPLPEVYRSVMPYLALRVAGVLAITYIPYLTLFLPGLLGR